MNLLLGVMQLKMSQTVSEKFDYERESDNDTIINIYDERAPKPSYEIVLLFGILL